MSSKLLNWVISGKKRLGRVLIGIFIFSSWVFISASSDELIPLLNNPVTSRMFVNFLTDNSIAFNLSLGFIVSSVFYFFVAYLPEERRKKHLKPIVKKRLESTLDKSVSLFKCLLKYSVTEAKLYSLSESDFEGICSTFDVRKDLNKGRLGIVKYPVEGVYYLVTPGVSLVSQWFQMIEEIEYLDEILPIFNDEELTAILLELEIKKITVVMRTLIKSESTYFSDYKSILVHIFNITNKLSEYHKENVDDCYIDPLKVIISSDDK